MLIEAWLACDKLSYPVGSMAKLLLLTGQRRNEVSGMTWAELDLDKALCRNDEAREIPLSDATLSVIASELGSHYALSGTTFAGRLRQWLHITHRQRQVRGLAEGPGIRLATSA